MVAARAHVRRPFVKKSMMRRGADQWGDANAPPHLSMYIWHSIHLWKSSKSPWKSHCITLLYVGDHYYDEVAHAGDDHDDDDDDYGADVNDGHADDDDVEDDVACVSV